MVFHCASARAPLYKTWRTVYIRNKMYAQSAGRVIRLARSPFQPGQLCSILACVAGAKRGGGGGRGEGGGGKDGDSAKREKGRERLL